MTDENQGTEGSEKDKAEEAAAKKVFEASFKATGNRSNDLHVVGGDDDADGSDDDQSGEGSDADDAGDDDQGDDDTYGQDTQAGGDNDKQDDKSKAAPEPTIKDVIAMVQGMQTSIDNKLTREVGGRLGRLEQKLTSVDAAKKVATESAQSKGKEVPTKERVTEALKSLKGLENLKKEFPDYAEVLEAGLLMVAEMHGDRGVAPAVVDEEQLTQKIISKINDNARQETAAKQEQEQEYAKIEDAWPGWKEGINSKPFVEWSQKKLAGPDGKDYDRVFKSGSTRETISMLQEFSKETGVQPKKSEQNNGARSNQQASNKNSDRLRRAASRPRGSASDTGTRKSTEEEIFQRSFKERRGG